MSLGGWDFTVLACQVNEEVRDQELPTDYVVRLAEEKAAAVLKMLSNQHDSLSNPEIEAILSADTAVIDQDDQEMWRIILGKPADAREAESMLLRLRGKTHRVATGLSVIRMPDRVQFSCVVVSEVEMRSYTLDEIHDYISTGDPFDKAGAYAIQSTTFNPVHFLHGCYANVMGLPLCKAAQILEGLGISPRRDPAFECRQALSIPCNVFSYFQNDDPEIQKVQIL